MDNPGVELRHRAGQIENGDTFYSYVPTAWLSEPARRWFEIVGGTHRAPTADVVAKLREAADYAEDEVANV